MEELLNRSVVFVDYDSLGATYRAKGKLIKVDQIGITLENKKGKKIVIPWQSFHSGCFIKEA